MSTVITPAAPAPATPVPVVVGSNLSISQILQGITNIELGTAPLIVQTFPSQNVVFGLEIGALGLELATTITGLIAALHNSNK
jgi:hypothetical protein